MNFRYLRLVIIFVFVFACTHAIPRFGISGRYLEGRDQFLRGRGGDMDRAIASLGSVVSDNPTYKDSLTLLGRAYYKKEMYRDAYAILQRAVAVNNEDEIAWVVLGLTQLRLNENEKGLETLKGAITLISKRSVGGYREFQYWDDNNQVRAAIRRCAFAITQGLEAKDNIFRTTEALLARMDEEENYQRIQKPREERRRTS
jgi:tetratricopeptide (TPR) repeat protein